MKFYVTLRNSLFGAVKLTKNADPDKYSYIHLKFVKRFHCLMVDLVRTCVKFGADMSSFGHVDNKKKIF